MHTSLRTLFKDVEMDNEIRQIIPESLHMARKWRLLTSTIHSVSPLTEVNLSYPLYL